MNKLKRLIARTPILGRALLMLARARMALGYFIRPLANVVKWLFSSRERDNFTYDLEAGNTRYLASLIADIANIEYRAVMEFIRELEADAELREHIAAATAKSDLAYIADRQARYGRRIGWYALTRALKPKVVVETGVDKGLGSCVITAALKRNQAEGHAGRYIGTDINPKAGYLLSGTYAEHGRIVYGDSIQSLMKLDCTIDLFINDSDHSADYEAQEYETVEKMLSARAVILGDNAHCTDKLLDFSVKTNRHFVFFQEKPKDHWYPGAGIGISFTR